MKLRRGLGRNGFLTNLSGLYLRDNAHVTPTRRKADRKSAAPAGMRGSTCRGHASQIQRPYAGSTRSATGHRSLARAWPVPVAA